MSRSLRLLACTALLAAAGSALAAPPTHAPAAGKKGKEKIQMGEVTWKVEPADVVITLDGKKVGTAAKAKPVKLKPGQHIVHLQWKKDEVEEPITIEAGKTIEFQYTFEDSGKPAE